MLAGRSGGVELLSELRLLVLLVERLLMVSSLSDLFPLASFKDLDICEPVECV